MYTKGMKAIVISIVVAMLTLTACATRQPVNNELSGQNPSSYMWNSNQASPQMPQKLTVEPREDNADVAIPLMFHEGKDYIPLQKLVELLGYQDEWDAETQTHKIGDNDVVYELKLNSVQAVKEEETVNIHAAPILLNGATYITKEAFKQLFQDDLKYELTNQLLVLFPPDDGESSNEEDLDFADDPNDETVIDEEVWQQFAADIESIEALKRVNRSSLIRTARKYLGVKYKFGAAPYATSKRFDCSSYTQHVYKQHGVSLKRLARNQAKQGIGVSRKNLRAGDLLFFYVPGRFKSKKIIGHVGIYMGKNQMIHAGTAPKNGVQITNINKAYWKENFVRARRVIA